MIIQQSLGKGKPIDLSEYFETPEEVRLAHSLLKNAGMTSREVDLLQEIAELKQVLAAVLDEQKKAKSRRRSGKNRWNSA